MKKAILILFCFFYTLSSAGMALNLHYCCGKLKSISLRHGRETNCCGKKKMKGKDCCKEKSIVYKVKDTQASGGNYFSFKDIAGFLAICNKSAIICPRRSDFNSFFLPLLHAPPEYDESYMYLVNGVFRI